MERCARVILMALLPFCHGCSALLPYEECKLVYSVSANGNTASVSLFFKNIRTPDDPNGTIKDPKAQYQAYTDPALGVLPGLYSRLLGLGPHKSYFPQYEKLPGNASIISESQDVLLAASLLGAFDSWDYSISKKGQQCHYTFEPSERCADDLGGTPWDWFCLLPACKVVAHNADETDPKTGEMRWRVERGKRKKKITFSLESVKIMMHGGW